MQPDYSLPDIPEAETPETDGSGNYVGSARCQARHPTQRPPVPYGEQDNVENTLFFEDGFKEVVGYLTEGRYLVWEKGGSALTSHARRDSLTVTPATESHTDKSQRWIIHYTEDEESDVFTISSALDGRWLGPRGILVDSDQGSDAEPVRISFLGNGNGYTLQYVGDGQYIDVDHRGNLVMKGAQRSPSEGFTVFSVSYHD